MVPKTQGIVEDLALGAKHLGIVVVPVGRLMFS